MKAPLQEGKLSVQCK